MKVKNIVLSLLLIMTFYYNYIFIYNLTVLSHDNYILFINTVIGIISLAITVLSSIIVFLSIIYIITNNWNKTITLNSILKTIKSIKLN